MVQSRPEGPCNAPNWFRSHAICTGGTWVFEKTLTVVGTFRPYAAAVRDRSMTETSGGQRWAEATRRCPPAPLAALYASITAQDGERYRLSDEWERDDLVANLVNGLKQCDRHIQERMVWHFLWSRTSSANMSATPKHHRRRRPRPTPAATQTLTEEEQQRLENLGNNGPATSRATR
jgi:hypothetical protein